MRYTQRVGFDVKQQLTNTSPFSGRMPYLYTPRRLWSDQETEEECKHLALVEETVVRVFIPTARQYSRRQTFGDSREIGPSVHGTTEAAMPSCDGSEMR